MDLKKGDLVRTVAKVEKIQAVLGKIKRGRIGVVVEASPQFDKKNVYGILIDGKVYYLFHDEIKKIEGTC